jgi:NADPH-dependent curcumin reductase CurA
MARQIVLAARPHGRPQPSDFRLEEIAIPTPASGQLLLEVQYLSLDPYMRGRMDDRNFLGEYAVEEVGNVMDGETVARVIASNHPDYSQGESSSRKLDGSRTRCRMAPVLKSLIPRWRRSRHASACSACPGSRPIPVCA